MLKVYINNDILKSLKNECRKLSGDIVGVYFLKLNGCVVYVGQSKNVKSRVMSHISIRQKAFDSFDIYECAEEELLETEKYYIKSHNPFYNVKFSYSEQITNSDFLIRNNIDFSIDTQDTACLNMTINTLVSNGINCEMHFKITDIIDKPLVDDLVFIECKKEEISPLIKFVSKHSGVDKKILNKWSKENGTHNKHRFLELLQEAAKELNDKANKMSEAKQ